MRAYCHIAILVVWVFCVVDAFSANTPAAALSSTEVQGLLDVVPVYAVTEPEKGGIVLVSEKDNDNEIAYFFFNPETANSVFSPLKEKKKTNEQWDVTQFALGLVWFELFQKEQAEGIEYRLVPDSKDLLGAQKVLDDDQVFKAAYNEIPLFVDQSLRLQGNDGKQKMPMYFGMQDLLESCQQAGKKDYQPTINIANFCNVVEQMQLESENDFRNVIFMPPTILPSALDGGSRIETESKNDDEPFETPTAMSNWDD